MQDLLAGLPEKLANKGLQSGLKAAGAEIVKNARRNVPTRLGNLRKSLLARNGVKVAKGRQPLSWFAVVGPGKVEGATDKRGKRVDPRNYAHLVEYGTKPHKIEATNAAGVLFFLDSAITEVDHPGARAKPFLRPAFDMSRGKVRDRIVKAVRRTLEKEALKKARRNIRRTLRTRI